VEVNSMEMPVESNMKLAVSTKWSWIWQILVLLIMLALTTVVNIFLGGIIQPSSLVFVYLVSTLAGAVFIGTWAAVFSFVGGFLIFNFLFVEPYYSLHIAAPQDVYNVTVYFAVAGIMTYLIRIVRRQNEYLKDRLDRTSLIEEMSLEFLALTPLKEPFSEASIRDDFRRDVLNQLGRIALRYISLILKAQSLVFFPEENGLLKLWGKSDLDLEITDKEQAAAESTFRSGEISGAGAFSHSDLKFFFIPMISHEYVIGVLGIRANVRDLFPEQRRILGAISNLTSLAAARWVDLKFVQG